MAFARLDLRSMLKKILSTTLLFTTLVLACPSFAAQVGGTGVGVVLGEPTGFSAKHWLSSENAIQGALAFDLGDRDYVLVQADYLWHTPGLVKLNSAEFLLHYGVGAAIGFASGGTGVAVRAPVGLSYQFKQAPIDLFVELAPFFLITPDTELDIQAGIGARYYF